MIHVDKEGTWFHRGAPIIHQGILQLFYRSIRQDEQGRYLLVLKEQTCVLEVEDTPFVIAQTTLMPPDHEAPNERIVVRLVDGTEEMLDPATLTVGADHVLYCTVQKGRFVARFSRAAYYQLARHIKQDQKTGVFFLIVAGQRYNLA
ncbi:MAG: DUF1285 domain-containing protein [Deltaproteobacteria bacterium]|nr:DUF1285 domain-containing protein [Deltaproteobacteria bacterium]